MSRIAERFHWFQMAEELEAEFAQYVQPPRRVVLWRFARQLWREQVCRTIGHKYNRYGVCRRCLHNQRRNYNGKLDRQALMLYWEQRTSGAQ